MKISVKDHMKNCCKKPKIKDLTQGLGQNRHWYCASCKAHVWLGKFYTAREWAEYVELPK